MLTCLLALAIPSYSQIDPKSVAESTTTELKLPTRKEAGKKKLSGVYTFIVELDGSLSKIVVKDSMGFGVDEQIIRQLSKRKDWKVAVVYGKPQRVAYSLPMTVTLDKK